MHRQYTAPALHRTRMSEYAVWRVAGCHLSAYGRGSGLQWSDDETDEERYRLTTQSVHEVAVCREIGRYKDWLTARFDYIADHTARQYLATNHTAFSDRDSPASVATRDSYGVFRETQGGEPISILLWVELHEVQAVVLRKVWSEKAEQVRESWQRVEDEEDDKKDKKRYRNL